MTVRELHRVPRTTVPLTRPGREAIAAPPQLSDGAGKTPVHFLLPVVGALSSMVMMVVLRNGQPLFLVVAAAVFLIAVVAGVAVAISSRGQERKANTQRRERYLDHLETLRADLRERTTQVRAHAQAVHPAPGALLALASDPGRVWERRRHDADFLTVRAGTGPVPWFSLVLEPAPPMEPYDPMLAAEAAQLVEHGRHVDAMPVLVDLTNVAVMTIVGPVADARASARAVVLALTATHSPDDVLLAAAFAPDAAPEWAGLDLLPHAQDPRLFDGPVPARRVAPDGPALLEVLGHEITDRLARAKSSRGQEVDQPRLVVLCDDHGARATSLPLPGRALARELGITLIHVLSSLAHEPDEVDVRLTIDPDGGSVTTWPGRPERSVQPVRPDLASPDLTLATARALAPLRMREVHAAVAGGPGPEVSGAATFLGIETVDDVGAHRWRARSPEELLRVPFATDDLGKSVYLDLKEAGQGGMGPHGLCVGATGSGKSEMLRTLILALATTHGPQDLSMILVDYKGGAAFAPFAALPHVAGLIDNLADDPQLTTRARASIQGEVVRRQRALKDVGAASIGHYRRLREDRPDLAPLPHLLVVIDEFAELLTAEPEFTDLFLQIGRIGRSVGIHLLFSSQRVEAGKLRGLDTYLSYRLGLRTFSESESQTVLGTTDAFSLPSLPGYGYLKVDTSLYTRFRAGYVSGPVPRERAAAPSDERPRVLALPTYNHLAASQASGDRAQPPGPRLTSIETGPTLIDEVVTRLVDHDMAVRPVWLEPLPDRLALGRVVDTETSAGLKVAVGRVDDPAHQRQDPWTVDLARAGGHLAIVGAPHAGRTTLLRTLVTSLALTHTPRAVAVYGMDLTGGGLSALEGFPHVGGIVTRSHRDRVGRLIEDLTATLATRERVFRERAIESMTHLRTVHEAGRVPELPAADVVVLIDGFGAVRTDLPELEGPLNDLISKGPGLGVHVVVGLNRWNELRIAQQALFGTRIELRVADPAESVIDRKLAGTITADMPGRALTHDGLLAQVALPVLDLVEPDAIGTELHALAARVAASWNGPSAAPIRLLPTHLNISTLPDEIDVPGAIPLGLRQDTMDTEYWAHLDDDQHLLVLADTNAGKSTVLRTIAAGLAARYTEDELAIAVLGTRGQVSPAVPADLLAADARTLDQAHGTALSIAAELAKRPTMSPDLRQRAPRIVVLVDDHDILAAGGHDPLAPLLPYLPSARDLGLHVILTRPVAGASRALHSPVLQSLRDTGAAILLMSGDRTEGPIVGRTYAEQLPAGRGRYIRRGTAPFIVQVAHAPATAAPVPVPVGTM
ncbi:type VII secretion protein EccCa [Oerskovia merdavium]|uniref:Type VII secretion protein EccCa n=1 Tax=Oerskovia merdavium TaxID=2762227 RepID=A0ABR8U4D6_9CELL|nr:type VII secretion protein EccCa [Oerskovia merdavium]MBD7982902.1 type VII secretion protein EccCa [Oerskovia merdavium]